MGYDDLKHLFENATDSAYGSEDDDANSVASDRPTQTLYHNPDYPKNLHLMVQSLLVRVNTLQTEVNNLKEQREGSMKSIQIMKNVDSQTQTDKSESKSEVPLASTLSDDHLIKLPDKPKHTSRDFEKTKVIPSDLDHYAYMVQKHNMINIEKYHNLIQDIRACDIRRPKGEGYCFSTSWIANLEKLAIDPHICKRIFVIKSDPILLKMLGGSEVVEEKTWGNLKESILNFSTKKDEIEYLKEIYDLTWRGEEDPLIFKYKLKRLYNLYEINQCDFNFFLSRNLTYNMIPEKSDFFKSYIKSDETEALAKITDIYHDEGKGKKYLFGPIKQEKILNQCNVYPVVQCRPIIPLPQIFYYPIYNFRV